MPHKKRKIVQTDGVMKLLCTKTGMGQQDFEILLGTKQSIISRYIKGIVRLPSAAMIKLGNIYLKVRNLPAVAPQEPTAQNKQDIAERASRCRFQAERLQRELDAMEFACEQAGHMLQFIEQDFMDGPLTPELERWKMTQYYAMQIKLKNNGWMPQHQLRVKIATLLQEAALNEAYI